jgi:hygromycin-B 4-O-kinase
MPHAKPTIEQEAILTLLNKQFGTTIDGLEAIQTGHMSQAYSFTANGKGYILRFNPSSESFEKDAYAYNHYASTSIPIPRIVTIGRVEELAYAISEKLPGTMLNFMSDAEYQKVIPPMLEVLDAIHYVDVSNQPHYGYVNARGIGQSASWRGHVADIYEEHPEDFYGHWHTLFQSSFLERSVFDTVYQKMLALLDYCPEERYLLHGDYGFDNVLAHEGKITAVLDWALSQYGDFLYDAAYLHYFSYQYNFLELFREFYASKNRSIPFYTERMICYTCLIGLNAMKFFAMAQLQQEYTWARERILSLVADTPIS